MENKILEKFLKVKSSTVDDMKILLEDVKMCKNEKLEQEIKKLQEELKEVKKLKKYWLVWEEKVEKFDEETVWKLPVLEEIKKYDIKNDESESNVLIQWDNYHTLSVLNYTHKGKIDVIYIDPPYNTGNNDFIYNDKIVDKEDTFRHSKWLSFMNKRLKLAKDLLSENWVIFISIDDNEFAQLKLLCEEFFWNNMVDNLIWRKAEWKLKNTTTFRKEHEYIIVCYKNNKKLNKVLLSMKEKLKNDSFNLKVNIWNEKSWYFYTIENEWYSWDWYWKHDETEMKRMILNWEIIFKNWNVPRWKPINKPVLLDSIVDVWSSTQWKRELEKIFWFLDENITPKPKDLINLIIKLSSNKNSTILDFFAGSGTTGHAVLELNKEDQWNRKFILATNNENNICEEVTYERLKRVMNWYKNLKREKVEGLGGNLKYLRTDFINKDNSNDDLRKRMVDRCSELLCLKENIWEEFSLPLELKGVGGIIECKIKIFKTKDKYLAILYDMFFLWDFKKILNSLEEKESISIYAFSHYKIDLDDFEDLKMNFEIEEIPDPILEVYDSIFGL